MLWGIWGWFFDMFSEYRCDFKGYLQCGLLLHPLIVNSGCVEGASIVPHKTADCEACQRLSAAILRVWGTTLV